MLLLTDTSETLAMITNAGFKIVSLKLTQLTVADAQAFYAVHCKTFLW
jgi:nucleoside diphosphate kinase